MISYWSQKAHQIVLSSLTILLSSSSITSANGEGTENSTQRGEGKVFHSESTQPLFLMQFEHINKSSDAMRTEVRYLSLDKKTELVHELVTYESGFFKEYRIKHNQTSREAIIRREGKRLIFTKFENGKTLIKEEQSSDNLVVGASLFGFFSKNFSDLQAGKTLTARFAAFDRMTTYDFDVVKTNSDCLNVKADFCIKMSISNVLLRPFIDTLYIAFNKNEDSFRPIRAQAPSLPRRMIGQELRSFLAITDYYFEDE